jgi:hypothetical protein
MKIDALRPYTGDPGEQGVLLKMYTAMEAGFDLNIDASITLADSDGTVPSTDFTIWEAPPGFDWPNGVFQVGYVPVKWELSGKLMGSVKSDAMLKSGGLFYQQSAKFKAKLGSLYCANGYIERNSDCYSKKQAGFTPINKVEYKPPTINGKVEPIEFDPDQLMSTTEFRVGPDFTLTFWGILPVRGEWVAYVLQIECHTRLESHVCAITRACSLECPHMTDPPRVPRC